MASRMAHGRYTVSRLINGSKRNCRTLTGLHYRKPSSYPPKAHSASPSRLYSTSLGVEAQSATTPSNTTVTKDPYWQRVSVWKDVGEDEFLRYRWQVSQFL
jgi:hypothetical protein